MYPGQTISALADAVSRNDVLIVAFSGGADSLLALTLAAEIAARNPQQRVIAWYCHHYPTAVETKRQSVFDQTAKKLSAILGDRWQLALHKADIERISKRLGYSWEHTASRVRRKHLLRFADRVRGGRPAVITGHNYSDYLETLALRRARQIPESGLPAPEFTDTHTGFLRPLYLLTRDEVRATVRECGFTAYEDPANADTQFARNRIRANLRATTLNSAIPATPTPAAALRRVHRRELHLAAADWESMPNPQRARTVFSAFRSLAVTKKFTRNHFARAHQLPFRLPPFFAHRENTAAGDTVVFRRGLGARVALPNAESLPYLRGDQVSRRVTIAAPFGHKSVSKIFSERRLSPRERRLTLVYLSPAQNDIAVRLVLPRGASL